MARLLMILTYVAGCRGHRAGVLQARLRLEAGAHDHHHRLCGRDGRAQLGAPRAHLEERGASGRRRPGRPVLSSGRWASPTARSRSPGCAVVFDWGVGAMAAVVLGYAMYLLQAALLNGPCLQRAKPDDGAPHRAASSAARRWPSWSLWSPSGRWRTPASGRSERCRTRAAVTFVEDHALRRRGHRLRRLHLAVEEAASRMASAAMITQPVIRPVWGRTRVAQLNEGPRSGSALFVAVVRRGDHSAAATRPSVAARLYAGAVEATPMTTLDIIAEGAVLIHSGHP